jgi:SOS-response transcriptional repressor LexA
MQDDSMAPTFVKGDLLTIDYDTYEEPGDSVLVRIGRLFLIRRYMDRGDNDHIDFMPENRAYPAILDDGKPLSGIRDVDTFLIPGGKGLRESDG